MPSSRPAIAPIARLGTKRPDGTLIPKVKIVKMSFAMSAIINWRKAV